MGSTEEVIYYIWDGRLSAVHRTKTEIPQNAIVVRKNLIKTAFSNFSAVLLIDCFSVSCQMGISAFGSI